MASEEDQTFIDAPMEESPADDGDVPGDSFVPAEQLEDLEREADDDSEPDDPLMGESADDPERARNYKEYKRLQKEIHCQNVTIEDIKNEIRKLQCKSTTATLSSEQKQHLRNLQECMDKETHKLRDLTIKAMHLQNFGSRRHYREIELVTTFDEEPMLSMPTMHCDPIQVHGSHSTSNKREPPVCRRWRASGGDTTTSEKSCSYQDEADRCESEDQKLMNEILATLQSYDGCSNKQPKKSCKSKANAKDPSVELLKQKLHTMQQTIDDLKQEICSHRKESGSKKECCSTAKPPCQSAKSQNFDKLKDNYAYLLQEFSKKEKELKDLTKRVKNSCGSAGENADASEIQLLTNRINDLKEEQIEFKCLMKEQSTQLEDYRNKYLKAQQKVEEQGALIEKLNMNNKRIEKQINLEIKDIRCKFQEKLNELVKLPKLLENEQIKVAKLCKEKEELENKLLIVCKELKTHKNKASPSSVGGEDLKTQLQKCQHDLEKTKKLLEETQRQRDLFCEQLNVAQEDLSCLRAESAKIIARMNERFELIKQKQQDHINCLEKQLVQCRATASLSVGDRECVIREMQGQLNNLSYSFDAAQKQIKTLRNHIAYMSNENCFPAKC
ncbi:227 kDa spindle- and centromere-associated protein [Musca domestica]|uniref:227 kDa spindle- and centromere-associated protein n=2 Tax=Musca domestica TaxID=7370 RepID=A0A9J7CNW9_MUSDO|nr:227 kDa spindle- and centromere-associated protein [Musca domestica]